MATKGDVGLPKIVCIDDDPQTIELLKLILTKNGFEGLAAKNGPDGLELIASEHPDLVLLDLMMPGMDGWTVYQRMKADETMQGIPVIVVTCKVQPVDEILARNIAKVDDYIKKPFSPGSLIDSINQVLGISGPSAN
jgi:DNA-binding response OmpR family regulator